MVRSQTVTAAPRENIAIKADTICIHGDGPHALDFAKAIRAALIENGVEINSV
jgi:UPF0271 protein